MDDREKELDARAELAELIARYERQRQALLVLCALVGILVVTIIFSHYAKKGAVPNVTPAA